jgi:cytochrome c peroxidase
VGLGTLLFVYVLGTGHSYENPPPNNLVTDNGAILGRVLFYDVRLSKNCAVSCASCHDQAKGFGDSEVASTGIEGTTGRHSMRLINSRFARERRFFWDGRANTLEIQTAQPILAYVEMGFSGTNGDQDFPEFFSLGESGEDPFDDSTSPRWGGL